MFNTTNSSNTNDLFSLFFEIDTEYTQNRTHFLRSIRSQPQTKPSFSWNKLFQFKFVFPLLLIVLIGPSLFSYLITDPQASNNLSLIEDSSGSSLSTRSRSTSIYPYSPRPSNDIELLDSLTSTTAFVFLVAGFTMVSYLTYVYFKYFSHKIQTANPEQNTEHLKNIFAIATLLILSYITGFVLVWFVSIGGF